MNKCPCGSTYQDFYLNAENNHLCFSCRKTLDHMKNGVPEKARACFTCSTFYTESEEEHQCPGVMIYICK